jgi:hypothetical protein
VKGIVAASATNSGVNRKAMLTVVNSLGEGVAVFYCAKQRPSGGKDDQTQALFTAPKKAADQQRL